MKLKDCTKLLIHGCRRSYEYRIAASKAGKVADQGRIVVDGITYYRAEPMWYQGKLIGIPFCSNDNSITIEY